MAFHGQQHFSRRNNCQEPHPSAMPIKPQQGYYGTQVLPRHAESHFHADYFIAQLHQELEETKLQLAKQKQLKEKSINDGKEIKRELERLQKYAHPDVLSAAKVSNQVRSDIKQRKKKDLQKDYEELKVAFLTNEQKFSKELQAEREKNKILQRELESLRQQLDSRSQQSRSETLLKEEIEHLKAAHQDQNAQIHTTRKEVEVLRQELEHERSAFSQELLMKQQIINSLKAEQDISLQTTAQQIATMTVATCKTELKFQAELQSLKVQLQDKDDQIHQLLEEKSAQQQPPVPVVTVIQITEDTQETSQNLENGGLQAIKEDSEDLPGAKKKSPSFWKRARHFLGLKKSKKNKNSASKAA